MSFCSGKRIVYHNSSTVVLVVIFIMFMFLFQISIFCACQAEAIRIFPGPMKKESDFTTTLYNNNDNKKQKKSLKGEALFHKYFHGSAFKFNGTTTTTDDDKGFEDNKRRVPSCPDPLHN